jgi:hypothetical protein
MNKRKNLPKDFQKNYSNCGRESLLIQSDYKLKKKIIYKRFTLSPGVF